MSPYYCLSKPVSLSAMIAIMIVDYFLVRHRRLSLINLFTNSPESIYWFQHGLHIRTFVCWLIGVLPFTPGCVSDQIQGVRSLIFRLAASVRGETLKGWSRLYSMGFILGFAITAVLYYGSNLAFPIPHPTVTDGEDVFGTFSELAPAEANRATTAIVGGEATAANGDKFIEDVSVEGAER